MLVEWTGIYFFADGAPNKIPLPNKRHLGFTLPL
jgi:hypothetical protein